MSLLAADGSPLRRNRSTRPKSFVEAQDQNTTLGTKSDLVGRQIGSHNLSAVGIASPLAQIQTRYGYTQDWLSSSLADSKNAERGNWWSDESSIGEKRSPEVYASNVGSWTRIDQSPLSGEISDSTRLSSLHLDSTLKERRGTTLSAQATPRRMSQDLYELLQSPLEGKLLNDSSGSVSGKEQPTDASSTTRAPNKDKELPPPPGFTRMASEATVVVTSVNVLGSPSNISRPSLVSQISFQRSRKRVNWRGKACIIALPSDDGYDEKSGNREYLKPWDVKERLLMWERQGYQTKGFSLSTVVEDGTQHLSEGQSRVVYPSPDDQMDECGSRRCRVSLPDRQEWDNYVRRLKEDKLRALGVTFEKEQSSSRNSPIPSSMSRHTSPHISAIQVSPTSVTSLSNGNLGQYSNQISPRLAPSIKAGPQRISQVAMGSQQMGKVATNHLQRYSIALPGAEKALAATYQFPQVQSPLNGTWSSQQHLSSQASSRVTTPSINGYVQGFGPMHTPGSMASPDYGSAIFNQVSHGVSPQIHYQQAQIQAHLHPPEYEQHQKVLHPQLVHTAASHRPLANGSRSSGEANPPEIANPIPRGHRQNLSENLQKGVDEAESHFEAPGLVANAAMEFSELALGDKDEGVEELPSLSSILQSADEDQVLKDSDFDTNPSIASTPKPLGTLHSSPSRGHSSKPSLSKMNANAPEFVYKPSHPLPAEVFAFSSNQQGAHTILEQAVRPVVVLHNLPKESVVNTSFNVAAPSFTPADSCNSQNASRVFSFSSSGPSFKPNGPRSTLLGINTTLGGGGGISELPNSEKIFGNINLSDIVKPVKKSRAIPIVRPNHKNEGYDQDPDGQEDESGRITQADGRQKRIRHNSGEGDQAPLFANPSNGIQPAQEVGYPSNSNLVADSSSTFQGGIPAHVTPTTKSEEIIDSNTTSKEPFHASQSKVVNADDEAWEPFSFQDTDDAANFNAARSALSSPKNDPTKNPNFIVPVLEAEWNSETFASHGASLSLTSLGDLEPRIIGAIRDVEQDSLPVTIGRADSSCSASRAENVASLPPTPPTQVFWGESSSASHSSALANHQDEPAGSGDFVLPGATDDIRRDTHSELILVDGVTYLEPSYDEIDAVMKHLNEEDSDIGVERNASPWQQRSPIRTSVGRVNDLNRLDQQPPTAHVRRDPPLPSPNTISESSEDLPSRNSDSPSTARIGIMEQSTSYSPRHMLSSISRNRDFPIQRLNRSDNLPVSDWDDAISSSDELKFQSRIKFFDHRINDLIGGIVQQRLQPLENVLLGIQDALAAIPSKPSGGSNRRSISAEVGTSDADDEDDSDDSRSRVKSPGKDRMYDKLKVLLLETVGLHPSHEPASERPEILEALKDLKSLVQQPVQPPNEIKSIIEEAIARQMRGRSAPIISSHESATVEKLQLQITGLESMLKIADTRADDELKARRATEDALADSQRLLRMAMQEAAEQRESAEETERSLLGFHDERHQVLRHTAMLEGAQESLQKTASDLVAKNAALEGTLDEYRLSSSQWRQEVEEAKRENKDLLRTIGTLKVEIEETIRGRQTLSDKFDRLQDDMTLASRDIARDQSRWRAREEEAMARVEALNARLESELRSKQELESTVERLDAQQKEAAELQYSFERSQRENADLERLLVGLKTDISEQDKALTGYKCDVHHITETARLELQRMMEAKDAEIDTARNQVNIVRSDLQAFIARLQSQVNDAAEDAKAANARHEAILADFTDSRNAALRDAADAKEAALHENSEFHERILSEASSQHARALQNALEDKARAEAYLNERLSLANERITLLEDKSGHLEAKLEIAKSAAHAAVLAAQSNKATSSLPSSGPSPATKDYDLPEKISPQALRESILVLQEQLQERESHVERLEKELLQFDRGAPEKLRNQEMEITWLRELLCVRVDDLEEIITTLSYPSYDREAVKDAAIRIKANLQMEQQGKERAVNSTFPSLGSISTIASSPRALPLAAAAAWSNWRKANGSGDQTPPARGGFLSGLLTPPRTNMQQPPSLSQTPRRTRKMSPTPKLMTPDVHRTGKRPLGSVIPPATPPLMRAASYDCDAESTRISEDDGDVAAEVQNINLVGATIDEPLGLGQ